VSVASAKQIVTGKLMHIDGYVGVVGGEQTFDVSRMLLHQFRVLPIGIYVGREFTLALLVSGPQMTSLPIKTYR